LDKDLIYKKKLQLCQVCCSWQNTKLCKPAAIQYKYSKQLPVSAG